MLDQIFGQEPDKADKIIALTKRLDEIDRAANVIKYDHDLVLEIPEALKILGAAKDALIAALKTI